MPNCKNDPNANYKGNEPSPKGLGYCAHGEKIGTIKKGNDGNKWIITETQTNIKRWIKFIQNKKNSKIKGKKYYVHDNGGRPFEVVVDKNNVYIYRETNEELEIYDKHVKTFNNVIKVHIGNYNKDKFFNGNTILLELDNNKFICIMCDIFEFELKNDDEFVKYFSEVGNSDVPYPVLVGKKYFYSMIEKTYTKLSNFPSNYKIKDFEKAHVFYYGNFIKGKGWNSIIKDKKKLPKLKIIHKKIY